jgi:FtsP/CotA-like multicopper oxidase with cupredoxin domain
MKVAPPRERPRVSTTLAFGLPLAYGAALWLVVRHHAEGATERAEPQLLVHWLRDATLALPAVLAAVWIALAVSARLLDRVRVPADLLPVIAAAASAVAASGALAAGTPVHGWLFAATEHQETTLLLHVANDAVLALMAALPIAGVVALFMLPGGARRVRLPRYAVASIAAAALAGTAYADIEEASLLRDAIAPCFSESPVGAPFTAALPIPPLKEPAVDADLTSDAYTIVERRGQAQIIPGITTPIWGYDGITPGPTIIARKGRPVKVTFVNDLPPDEDPSGIVLKQPLPDPTQHEFLPSSTSVHLHGINGDHFSDGYPTDNDTAGHKHRKNPGETFFHLYENNEYQRPATLWYHDHTVHVTSNHLYRGLAGFYIVRDAFEDTLRLPGSPLADPGRGYGFFDVPLMLKDVMIDPASRLLLYDNCSHMGAFGDVMTVNGKQQPRLDVANRKYRFRLLNASDARQYMVALRRVENLTRDVSDPAANEPFTLIGTDHGLLRSPVTTDRIHAVIAERYELVIDFSRYPVGTQLRLVNLLTDPQDRKLFPLMAFKVNRAEQPDPSEVPPVLRPDASPATAQPDEHPADQQPASAVRIFDFSKSNGPYWSINGQIFDARRDDADPALNTSEDWILDNSAGGWGHPVHIHLGRFKVMKATDIEGRRPRPGELEGWKDVIWLGPNQRIRVRHQFWNFTDRFVFHCHNGSHEDFDMMGQFAVRPS